MRLEAGAAAARVGAGSTCLQWTPTSTAEPLPMGPRITRMRVLAAWRRCSYSRFWSLLACKPLLLLLRVVCPAVLVRLPKTRSPGLSHWLQHVLVVHQIAADHSVAVVPRDGTTITLPHDATAMPLAARVQYPSYSGPSSPTTTIDAVGPIDRLHIARVRARLARRR